ncbi:MAG: hypothetical protein K8T25_17125 [Planctomycetia bacterium]|nr:hypothetical protein [Planctomycetia bacterium]
MSNYSSYDSNPSVNPYDSPREVEVARPVGSGDLYAAPARRRARPTFCGMVFITDIIICILRALVLVFAIYGLRLIGVARAAPELPDWMVYTELGTMAGVALLGLIASAMMLANLRMGVAVGWLAVVATALSIIMVTAEVLVKVKQLEGSVAAGYMIGMSISFVFRVAYCVMYGWALSTFDEWFVSQGREEALSRPVSRYVDSWDRLG